MEKVYYSERTNSLWDFSELPRKFVRDNSDDLTLYEIESYGLVKPLETFIHMLSLCGELGTQFLREAIKGIERTYKVHVKYYVSSDVYCRPQAIITRI